MLTVIARHGSLAEVIAGLVEASTDLCEPAAIIDAVPDARAAPLAELSNSEFEAGCIAPMADLAAALVELIPAHRRILLIGETAGLGAWDAALTGAFAAGAVGLMRSVALEYAREGLSINYLALSPNEPSLDPSAAAIAGALLSSGLVSGQIIICDGGANLRMRAARPRRATLPVAPSAA